MAGSPLMLPSGLANFLNDLGYTWPKSDEVKMFELGQKWIDFGGQLQQIHGEGNPHAETVHQLNKGLDIDAFKTLWEHPEHGAKVIKDGGTGSMVVGAGLFVAAGLVLALKITVIVQITILAIEIAQAIATAVPTFGASLLEIPVFKKIADLALNFAISKVMNALLG